MKNKIKFRVWKDQHTSSRGEVFDSGWISDTKDALLDMDGRIYEDDYGTLERTEENSPSLTVELHAGFLDIQGHPIYDGDIVIDMDKNTYIVNFGPYDSGDGEVIYGWSLSYKPSSDRGYWVTKSLTRPRSLRIIGNIHENKDLFQS
jgi:hypothetical protein